MVFSFTSKNIPVIAVKMGKQGAVCYADNRKYECKPIDVKVTDTVGAGDNFDAGFVYAYLSGYSIEDALKTGCITGSMSTREAGGVKAQADLRLVKEYL